jgi:hypothetical protein
MFGSMSDYVSSDYPESVREPLLSLGITAPTWKWVSDKLQELHDGGLLLTKMQSKEWCSDLAKVILAPQAPRGDRTYASDLGRIPLIPLADGTWKCPPSGDENFYFPASLGTTIPPGLPLNLVDEDACTCPKRVRLFRLLGVQDCDVPNVVERILEYHDELSSATGVHVIAQIKYLYKMREHLVPGDMKKVSFACSKKSLKKGTSIYADISVGGELRQIFSGYSKAHFLSNSYFVGLDPFEKSKFAEWLCETASVALAPRFISGNSSLMHRDFVWLRYNKPDQLLDILRQHWSLYKKIITSSVKQRLAYQGFACKSGVLVELCNTYIPLPSLVEKVQTFGNAGRCNFLALPSGDPNEWKFLSSFGVGVDEGLDFYLWVLKQPGFIEHIDVDKSKELYLTIQSEAFYPSEKEKVR